MFLFSSLCSSLLVIKKGENQKCKILTFRSILWKKIFSKYLSKYQSVISKAITKIDLYRKIDEFSIFI